MMSVPSYILSVPASKLTLPKFFLNPSPLCNGLSHSLNVSDGRHKLPAPADLLDVGEWPGWRRAAAAATLLSHG